MSTAVRRALAFAFVFALCTLTACSEPEHRLGLSRQITVRRGVSTVGFLSREQRVVAIRQNSYDGVDFSRDGTKTHDAVNGQDVTFSIAPSDLRFENFYPAIRHAPGGDLWLSEPRQKDLVNLSRSTVLKLPESMAIVDLLPLEDGSLIFSDGKGRKLWKVPASLAQRSGARVQLSDATLVAVANLDTSSDPNELALCSDAHVWFTESNDSRIGRIDVRPGAPMKQRPQQFLTGVKDSYPISIARGHDGTCWITLNNAGKLIRLRTDLLAGKDDLEVQQMWNTAQRHVVEEQPLPRGAKPDELVLGPDGRIWFTDDAGAVGRVDSSGRVEEFPLPDSDLRAISDCGPKAVCVADASSAEIKVIDVKTGRLLLSSGTMQVPTTSGDPYWVATVADRDGTPADALRTAWFTELRHNRIGAIDLGAHPPSVTEYEIPDKITVVPATCARTNVPETSYPQPAGIAADRNGTVWFTEYALDRIGRFDPKVRGTRFVTYDICDPASRRRLPATPKQITVASDGQIWFTEPHANMIGRFNPDTHGFTEYAIPTPDSVPEGITEGPDGAMWFTESAGNKIGRIAPDGRIYEVNVPTANSLPMTIVSGKGEGNRYLWFTEFSADRIGRLTTFGHIDEFRLHTAFSEPLGIAASADGAWFTEFGVSPDYSRIGHISNDGRVEETDIGGSPVAIALLQRPSERGARNSEELWITLPVSRSLYELGF